MKYKLSSGAKKGIVQPNEGDAGYDLIALAPPEGISIRPGCTAMIKTGVHLEIPEGHVGLIKDRSSMGARGMTVLGGVVDSSYRGEVKVLLANVGSGVVETVVQSIGDATGYHVAKKSDLISKIKKEIDLHHTYTVNAGDKIAQIVIVPIYAEALKKSRKLTNTSRQDKGFGSTGRKA